MTLLQHHAIALIFTAATTCVLGLLVFIADPRRALNRVFALYSGCLVWWSTSEYLIMNASNDAAAERWSTWAWLGISFIAPTFLHSVFLLTEERSRRLWLALRFGYGFAAVFDVLHLSTNLMTTLPRPIAYERYFATLTPIGFSLPTVFLVLVSIGMWKLWHGYRDSFGQRKTQMKYLFWSLVVGYVGGSPDWALAMGLYIPGLNPFGIYGVPLYSVATTYAVLQHQFFDIRWVIKKSIVYSLLVTTLTVSYFGFIYGAEQFWRNTMGYHSPSVSLAAFAAMALLFQPLKVGIQRFVDILIFRAPQHAVAKRLEMLEQKVREGEQYKAVAMMAAEIAHEMKNPLTALQTFVEFLPERYQDSRFRQQFQEVVAGELQRLRRVAQGLLDFSKPQAPQMAAVDIQAVIEDVLALTRPMLLKRGIVAQTAYVHNGAQIIGDAAHLRQAFLNLVRNADQAMPPCGTLAVSTRSEDGFIEVRVRDSGCGIHPKDLPHLFDPFFSKKIDGTGLGLSIVQGIIREHHGTIAAQSVPGQGTTMVVRLPAQTV